MPTNWEQEVRLLMEQGKSSLAIPLLEKIIQEPSSLKDRLKAYERLLTLLVHHSSHKRALEAKEWVESFLKIRWFSWAFNLCFSYLLCWTYLMTGRHSHRLAHQIACFSTDKKSFEEISWSLLRALLFANYWNNIRATPTILFLMIAKAHTEEERLRSIAWLAYSLGYTGHTFIASRTISKVIRYGITQTDTELNAELYPFLGIVYQMGSSPEKALETYDEFEARYPDFQGFHQLLLLTNKINLATAYLPIIEVEKALDRCFRHSFALNESRHHIQIYGAKACLLAIDRRKEESLEMLSRSSQAAEKNSNPLDFVIYRRFAMIVHYELGLDGELAEDLIVARSCSRKYGRPNWHEFEISRLEAMFHIRKSKTRLGEILASIYFLIGNCLRSRGYRDVDKTCRLFWRFYSGPVDSYWSEQDLLAYFSERVRHQVHQSDQALLGRICHGLTKALLETASEIQTESPSLSQLVLQIETAFKPEKIFLAKNIPEVLELSRKDRVIGGLVTVNRVGDRIRLPCLGGSFIIGLQIPKTKEVQEDVVLCTRLSNLDTVTESLVEASLRIMIAQFVLNKTLQASRAQHVNEQRRLAVTTLALQVAHDIRSPLAALKVASSVVTDLDGPTRHLIRSAVNRISDIANTLADHPDLSLKGLTKQSSDRPTTEKHSPQLLSSLVDSVISEKRMQFRRRFGLSLEARLAENSYPIFATLEPGEFKRVLSNLINNSVEAIEDDGKVIITLERQGENSVILVIEDTGKGISPLVLPHLMKQGGTFGKEGGSGLGLFHASESLGRWGGTISIQSIEGTSTKISMTLPLAPLPNWFVDKIQVPDGTQFVVVDDDESIHQIWNRRFSSMNGFKFRILNFTHSTSVLEWAKTRNASSEPVFFLVDQELIGDALSGLDLIEKLGIPSPAILVTSRHDEPQVVDRCLRMGIKILPKFLAGLVPVQILAEVREPVL